MTRPRLLFALLMLGMFGTTFACAAPAAEPQAAPGDLEILQKAKRVLFLGDSITHAGQYVAGFEAWLLVQLGDAAPLVINAGLPSETVSGLSEAGHAGGKFPRPDLHERIDRVLAVTKPDLVFACYGINCGIYQPLDEDRFAKYRAGIERLKEQVEAAHAKIVFITPPTFDDARAKNNFSYNGVLDRYSEWLLKRRDDGWQVVDLHAAMNAALAAERAKAPNFTFQPDAVHPNAAGQWFVARQLISHFGGAQGAQAATPQELLAGAKIDAAAWPLLQQRMNVIRDAYVGAAGHKRPGIGPGLPIADAEKKAADVTKQILALRPQP